MSNPYSARRANGVGGTVGMPLPGVAVRVVDERGMRVPEGEIGQVQVRGPNVFAGYWRLPEKTAEEFTPDGFFRTGDVGQFGGQGGRHYLTHRRPQQGPDHLRRLQRLPEGDRGLHRRTARAWSSRP